MQTIASIGTVFSQESPLDASGAGEEIAPPQWIQQARRSITTADTDFFRVSPLRYWLDFILSLTAAYASATVYLVWPIGSWQQILAFPVAAFWLYRLGSLIHEVCHLGQHEMPLFKAAWNL